MAPASSMEELESKPYDACYSLVFFFIFISLVWLIKSLGLKTGQIPKANLPPGPWKLPIIGNLIHLLGSLPHHAFRDLALRYGPVMHLQLGQVSTIVVSDAKTAKEIMRTHDLVLASRPQLVSLKELSYQFTDIALAPYGAYWRQVRKICVLELLSMKRVQSFGSIREEEVSAVVRTLSAAAGTPVNLTRMVLSLINNIVFRVAIGDKCRDQQQFMEAMMESLELAGGFSVSEFFPSLEFVNVISGTKSKSRKTQKKLDRILNVIFEECKRREKSKISNFVDVLFELQRDADLDVPLTMDNIKAIIQDMFVAGTETSATVIDWVMVELIRNPRVMKKAQQEVRDILRGMEKVKDNDIQNMNYLKSIIKETLRLHPPLPFLLPRESIGTCKIEGYDIPIGTRVIVNAWAIGRNPEDWENPNIFKPERF